MSKLNESKVYYRPTQKLRKGSEQLCSNDMTSTSVNNKLKHEAEELFVDISTYNEKFAEAIIKKRLQDLDDNY